MNRSEFIEHIYAHSKFSLEETELTIKYIIETMTDRLCHGQRIEVRGFGAFTVKKMPAREAHNPKTGKKFITPEKYRIHFKPGKALKDRLNETMETVSICDEDSELV